MLDVLVVCLWFFGKMFFEQLFEFFLGNDKEINEPTVIKQFYYIQGFSTKYIKKRQSQYINLLFNHS